MASDWSRIEVEALVADYLSMLTFELLRAPYSKTAHRRALAPLLNERSDGAIERKHQNVSAILLELGYPYVFGYKPLGNYQALLADVVADRIGADRHLAAIVMTAVEAPAPVPAVADLLSRWEPPPEGASVVYAPLREHRPRARPPVNYLEREARNISLGLAGEEFVVRYERARLRAAGRERLAERIEHVAVTEGDGAGFDVRSFEADGRDRLIEVKTTAYGKHTPFFLSRNEVAVSERHAKVFHLYRLFHFREDPRLYGVSGALSQACVLEPVQFAARVKTR